LAWATWCYRSWTSLGSLMYRAHLARWHRHEGPTAAGLRRPPQPAQGLPGAPPSSCTSPPTSSPEALATAGLSSRGGTARSPSKQLYFATYLSQPRGSRYGRAFLARRHRPEALPAAVLRHLHQPAPGPSLRPGFPREEAPPGAPPSSYLHHPAPRLSL